MKDLKWWNIITHNGIMKKKKYETIVTYGIEDTMSDSIPMEVIDKDDCEYLVDLFNSLPNEFLIERWSV